MAAVLVRYCRSSRSSLSWSRRLTPVRLSRQPAAILSPQPLGDSLSDTGSKRDRLLSLVRKADGVLIPSALEYIV